MARYCGVLVMALNDVLRNLNKVTKDTEKKAEIQIKKCCEDLLSKAVDITPIDTGELRKSGTTDYDSAKKTGRVTFGVGAVEYAVAVHEMPNETNWTEPGTGNKYLEKPLKANSEKYLQSIAKAVEINR